ncbi:putative F-box/kelch-repeat protein [Cardamine amara subsp. amara]|uniref:F-box/kelch-repeat protein n=1 Tax=Cardamine amara subsp. amara TaxID=228776 RepID=A0ABD0ZNG8_CARAN
MTNPIAPPPKRHKKTNCPPHVFNVLSSLPDEIVVSVLARIPRSYYRSICLVSKSFYSLLSSPEMYAVRSEIGATEPRLYVFLRGRIPFTKKNNSWFTLMGSAFNLRLKPVSLSSTYAPARFNSTTVSVGFEIYHIGGTVLHRSKAVGVLDCRYGTWRRIPNLIVARKYPKSCFLDGKIYVIGGVEAEESSMKNWGEVFDIKLQTWMPFPSPSDYIGVVDPNYQVVVFGARLYVITKHNNYAYDPKQGRWLPPDVGLVGLAEVVINRPFCVIENVFFAECGGKYKWYDSRYGMWIMVENLESLYCFRRGVETISLVNHGGKLVIMCYAPLSRFYKRVLGQSKNIMYGVIRLAFLGTHIRGELENWDIIERRVPKSCKLLACLSVSL